MDNLVPHQLALGKTQIAKLMKGEPFQIAFKNMGKDAGETIIMLEPKNAMKLLNSYKKGKGLRMMMTPTEIDNSMKHGRGIVKSIRKTFADPFVKEVAIQLVRYGSPLIGTAIGTFLLNPVAGFAVGEAIGIGAEIALNVNDESLTAMERKHRAKQSAKEMALEAMKKAVPSLPPEYREVATKAITQVDIAPPTATPPENKISSSYMRGYGTKLIDRPFTVRQAVDKTGKFMKDPKKMIGFGAEPLLIDRPFTIRQAVDKTGKFVKDPKGMIGFGLPMKMMNKAVKGSPEMKAKMAMLRSMKGKGIGKDLESAFKKIGKKAKPVAETSAYYAIPAITGTLGGIAGTMATGNPVGTMAGSALGSYAGAKLRNEMGINKGKRTKEGMGAMTSPIYQKAMKLNQGVVLNNVVADNKPVSNFKRDSRVRPSSSEMTLSPYQSVSSPAMNPFVPTFYTQEGGMDSGYRRGKGLYA